MVYDLELVKDLNCFIALLDWITSCDLCLFGFT